LSMTRSERIRALAAPSSGLRSAPRNPSTPACESSPARGGETEPPPPRGSRRLRARARNVAAPRPQAFLRAGTRAGARPRARRRARTASARSEHLGAAPPRTEGCREARTRCTRGRARESGRAAAMNAATQGLVRLPVWRARFVLALLVAGFGVLAGRSIYLQAVHTDFLQEKGDARYSRVIDVPATRGRIVDRHGDALAVSTPVKSIWAIPSDAAELPAAEKRKLGKLLGLSAAELGARLAAGDRDFVYLKRQVAPDVADAVARLDLPGIHQHREYRRYYPAGEVAAHVVGFTGVEDAGQEGIELAYQQHLAGKPGSRRVIKDRLGRIVEDVESIRRAEDGRDLALSIDGKLQSLAYGALKQAVAAHRAKAAALVALDVRSGEILALVNLPSFNPNNRARLTGA